MRSQMPVKSDTTGKSGKRNFILKARPEYEHNLEIDEDFVNYVFLSLLTQITTYSRETEFLVHVC